MPVVPLISGLGLTPITQDRIVICMFGVLISGIARICRVSAAGRPPVW